MKHLKTSEELGSYIQDARKKGQTVAFIPTMGALHAGHLALVEEGLKRCDIAVVSIFVNPTQFAPHEDFDSYPRTLDADIQKLEQVGAQAVWTPSEADLYPDGPVSDIHVSGVSEPLEGTFRPHFFDGVASVVARLLRAVKPDIACFGEKDYQQLQVVQKMVAEQQIPVEIVPVGIVRGESGLALSSRNAYLDEAQHKIAVRLNRIDLEPLLRRGLLKPEIENIFLRIIHMTGLRRVFLRFNPLAFPNILRRLFFGFKQGNQFLFIANSLPGQDKRRQKRNHKYQDNIRVLQNGERVLIRRVIIHESENSHAAHGENKRRKTIEFGFQ